MTVGRIFAANRDGAYVMKFVGDVRLNLCIAVDEFLDRMFNDPEFRSVLVDLSTTEGIDSTSLGMLAKLSNRTRESERPTPVLVSTNPDITRLLLTMGFDDVFQIIEEPLEHESQLGELPGAELGAEDLRSRVLEAHRTLMGMNEHNRLEFKDLVATLEASG
ncbi:MAG: STAS domain-containing protein [Gammaproteobacteria bacterium]|nr:STAS domain-containing protein [Gammaproteobacteria bacterium]